MVTKTRDEHFHGYVDVYTKSDSNVNNSSSQSIQMDWQDTRTGVNNPNHRAMIRNHQNATTPLLATKSTYGCVNGFCELILNRDTPPFDLVYRKSGAITVLGAIPGNPTFPSSGADNQAITKFINRATSAQRSVQGAVFLGELGQTLRMIRRPAEALFNGVNSYLNKLRKLDYRKGRVNKARGTIRKTWLEYTFGWAPLVSDLDGAMKALAKERGIDSKYAAVSSFAKEEKSKPGFGYGGANGPQTWSGESTVLEQWMVIYRGEVYTFCENPVFYNAANYGFAWRDFFPTVWELIPYSFLVDYFVNIGDVLNAFSFSSSNFAWKNVTYVSLVTEVTGAHFYTPQQSSFGTRVISDQVSPGACMTTNRSVNRSAHQGYLIPTLGFRHPQLGSLKWLNIAALTANHKLSLSHIHSRLF